MNSEFWNLLMSHINSKHWLKHMRICTYELISNKSQVFVFVFVFVFVLDRMRCYYILHIHLFRTSCHALLYYHTSFTNTCIYVCLHTYVCLSIPWHNTYCLSMKLLCLDRNLIYFCRLCVLHTHTHTLDEQIKFTWKYTKLCFSAHWLDAACSMKWNELCKLMKPI